MAIRAWVAGRITERTRPRRCTVSWKGAQGRKIVRQPSWQLAILGAWRLLLLAPVAGLVLGGAVAAHGAPSSHRWRFGALVAVPYTVIVLLTAILASLSMNLSVAALDLDLAFRASLAWALLILPVAAGLGAAGALLARTGSIPSAHPKWFGIITAAACGILVLGTVPLVASSFSDVPPQAKALAPPSATAPKSTRPNRILKICPRVLRMFSNLHPPRSRTSRKGLRGWQTRPNSASSPSTMLPSGARIGMLPTRCWTQLQNANSLGKSGYASSRHIKRQGPGLP